MKVVLRSLATLALLAVAAFCGFGFVASYESPDFGPFRVIYGAVGVACAAGVVAAWWRPGGRAAPGP